MAKKYRVTLTDEERQELEELAGRRSGKSLPVKRACILLAADENGEQRWTDQQICAACSCESSDCGARPAAFCDGESRNCDSWQEA